MAASRKFFFATFPFILILSVFVMVTSAQVTFNRQWRRGNYPIVDKMDLMEIGELTFTNSETPQSTIVELGNPATAIILSGKILGEIWKESKSRPSPPYQMQPPIQQLPIYWKLMRSYEPMKLSNTLD